MKKRVPILLIVACAGAFIFGLLQLFKLRFEQGDVYPEYSSLRADPLGTMAFYESLEQLPGMDLQRDYSDANKLPAAKGTTYLHIAGRIEDWESFPDATWKEIDGFLLNGGRLAITFYPETTYNIWPPGMLPPTTTVTNTASTNAPGFKGVQARRRNLRKQMQQAGREVHEVTLEEHWGVQIGHQSLSQDEEGVYQPVPVWSSGSTNLPKTLSWHSGAVFTNLDSSWKTIYARGKAPVVVERKFGAGSVVMATDSFFLSNEAMRDDRHAELLAWLVGPNQRIYFDEAHLGMVEHTGVAVLVRKYRLHGLAIGLIVLAGLFIWKNALSLVPPLAAEKVQGYIKGKDTAAGFVNLLRRNIPIADLINVCFNEWTKTFLQGRHCTLSGVDQAQVVLEEENARVPTRRDPVDAYRRICAALDSRKFRLSLSSSEFQVPSSESVRQEAPLEIKKPTI